MKGQTKKKSDVGRLIDLDVAKAHIQKKKTPNLSFTPQSNKQIHFTRATRHSKKSIISKGKKIKKQREKKNIKNIVVSLKTYQISSNKQPKKISRGQRGAKKKGEKKTGWNLSLGTDTVSKKSSRRTSSEMISHHEFSKRDRGTAKRGTSKINNVSRFLLLLWKKFLVGSCCGELFFFFLINFVVHVFLTPFKTLFPTT